MKRLNLSLLVIGAFLAGLQGCVSQPSTQNQSLPLLSSIALHGVSGRIDHLAFDRISQRIFVAALGNNSIEVVDLKTNKSIHSIHGLSEPQGVIFIPESNSIFVANGGNGVCDVFDATSLQKTTSIQLPGDADNVRYDSINKKYL